MGGGNTPPIKIFRKETMAKTAEPETNEHPNIFVRMFRGENKQWYWHARHKRNHRIMADGGEGYKQRSSCMHGINTIFPGGVVIFEQQITPEGKKEWYRVQ